MGLALILWELKPRRVRSAIFDFAAGARRRFSADRVRADSTGVGTSAGSLWRANSRCLSVGIRGRQVLSRFALDGYRTGEEAAFGSAGGPASGV